MTDKRDPLLESLFAESKSEPVDDAFCERVMENVEKRRRNVLIGRIAIVAVLLVFELLLSAPLQNSVGILTEALSASLIEMKNGWLAVIVAPVNSVAGLVGVLFLGLHTLYRRKVR